MLLEQATPEIFPVRKTKIVATVGPASMKPGVLAAMMSAGLNVVRLNLSHGDVSEHVERMAFVRKTAADLGLVVAVLADLPGPKVRAGSFGTKSAFLAPGAEVEFVVGNQASSATRVEVDYPTLLEDLSPGDKIVLGDGAISMRITSIDSSVAKAVVLTGGNVAGRPGVHLPAARLRQTTPTPEDLVLAKIMAEAGADFLAVSFVRAAGDVERVRQEVAYLAEPPKIVAKIETGDAANKELDSIVEASDAVMVARGDLGIDCDLADVPHIQKRIIRTCVEAGVPVITATQMLETMITSPTPTRAEVSDVANAVFDGTDAVMLSGETAVGHDPTEVVRVMSEICERAEAQASYKKWSARLSRIAITEVYDRRDRLTKAVTHAAVQGALDAQADGVICCTLNGNTAIAMARFRPMTKLIAATPSERTLHTLALSWGVVPIQIELQENSDDMVWFAVEMAAKYNLIQRGELIVVLAGTVSHSGAPTDLMRFIEVN